MSFFRNLFRKSEKNIPSEEKSMKIFPRIKVDYSNEIYRNDKNKSIKGNPIPKEWGEVTENQSPIISPLYEDLILCFAYDNGDKYIFLQNEFLEDNPSLTLEALHQICVNTLIQEIGGKIKIEGDPNSIIMVIAGGNFEAAMILIQDFWEQMHKLLNGNVIIAIPAKDLLFICKEENKEAITKIAEMVKGYFDNPETEGLLSKAIYLKEIGKNELRIVGTAF